MRVLYIDDDRVNIMLFEETCRHAPGAQVASASNGEEALEVAREFAPELLIIDLHLPGITGYELLARLREVPGLGAVPAILCSAESAADVRPAALGAGFSECWEKPVELQTLIARL
ncbi:MAG: response regulator, partial [Burkholderiales bacterium]|nr:response regulator [Burkholderiales bacterium]